MTMRRRGSIDLSRRHLLAGLGLGTALAPFLPLLNASALQAQRPLRLLLLYTPDGSPDGTGGPINWKPTGTETAFTLADIHKPLEAIKSKIVVPWGLKMSANGAGEQHAYGMAGLWTASTLHDPQDGADFDGGNGHRTGWGSGPSIDQVVAAASGDRMPYQRPADDPLQETPFRTLELGVQCGEPHSVYRMLYKGDSQPIHPEVNARAAFDRLFGQAITDPNAAARTKAEKTAILNLVKGDLDRLRTRTSSEDFPKIEAHLEGLRAIERRLEVTAPMGCSTPVAPPSTKSSNATFPSEISTMLDLVLHAFACDLTRVASVQISHGFSGVVHTWLGQTVGHHTMSHDTAVDRRPELTAIDAWYATQIAQFLGALDAVNEGNGTLLDNTLVIWGRELGTTSHRMQPHPVILAGGA